MNVLSTPPIRIRMVPRNSMETRSPFEQEPSTQNELRYAFWRAIFQPVSDDLQAGILEKKLRDIFGTNLHHLIINKLAEPLQQVTQALSRDEGGDIRELLIRYLQEDSNRDRAQYRPQTVDVAMRLIEQRDQIIRNSPELSRAQERIRVATSTIFAIRIAPYSSLNFDLFITPIKNIVEAFDNNFDTFRVFLDVFIPQAFSQAFGDASASVLDFSVHIPAEFERAFASIPEGPQDNTSRSGASNMTAAAGERIHSGRERAEWLWRLANGSLLVPLLLALCVMYYGVAMLKEFTSKQNEALMPMLAHQLKLLEEDRIRLSKEQTIPIDALKSIVEHQMKLLEEDRRRLVREPPATKTRKNDAGSVSN